MSLSLIGIGYFALHLEEKVGIKNWLYYCYIIIGIGSLAGMASIIWLRKAHMEGKYYRDLQKRLMIMNQPNRFETRVVKCRQSIHPSKLSFS
ncbi:Oidioi.mRNA.OKI2018_I69.chr2.g8055.t1.cds [Oikopleura dioica]|uniref:Oidioi.mRNA.OKI2018_I69.chr2.g8055.t1.cds n=1 Tax=Oikopleura dioica TaxID=34765 RepID=A0ABN7TCL7_OIKDI|nr:Oidioi.mRNA.OKI2018_I69.chr2.g8055.t1.cds [Oikopleura dioica]